MTTISDRDRAEAQAMHECPSTDRRALGYYRHPRMDGQTECPECGYPMHEHGWLDCGGDGIVVCPSLHGPFGGQAVTDHARNHTCPTAPVWRPTTRDEIRAGWEVRSRGRGGIEMNWGIAHHRDSDGDWRTEAGAVLTAFTLSWTYETTAAPEPEPWDEALVGVVSDALAGTEDPGPHWDDDARRVLDALAAHGYLDRTAITGGEQS